MRSSTTLGRFLPGVILCLLTALGSAQPAAAEDGYLTITKADCARLALHYPAPDVAYQPGRDVRGKKVVPADLDGGNGLVLPEEVVIPIEVDLFDRYGIPANGINYKGDIFIGEVVVDVATGRAIFNGQPLQSEAEAELAARCQRIVRDRAEGQ
ncbi:hypothetical protein [Pelagibius marinus]|uniref:hypothetical protein n=1 Tax=Pelagibius marinus TaxID=2762760 RepID=UPI00187330B2|nr:hypothetical protein [Pelagibius marinus]